MEDIEEAYLGDGLYASYDGYQIRLRAPRPEGDSCTYLEQSVFDNLVDFANTLK